MHDFFNRTKTTGKLFIYQYRSSRSSNTRSQVNIAGMTANEAEEDTKRVKIMPPAPKLEQNYGSLPSSAETEDESEYLSVSAMKQQQQNSLMVREAPSNEYVLNVAFISFVGFMVVQAFFAIVANSESMLADSMAMSVDALTYLFNMLAERIKNRPPTAEELELPVAVREHQIEMRRLYLELIPPCISVCTLICVTIQAMGEATRTLFDNYNGEEEDVSAGLMLFFSGLNLMLDFLNVSCFAQAHQAYGLQRTAAADQQPMNSDSYYEKHPEEANQLIERDDEEAVGIQAVQGSNLIISGHNTHDEYLEDWFGNVNLNMCSAWTVSVDYPTLSAHKYAYISYAMFSTIDC